MVGKLKVNLKEHMRDLGDLLINEQTWMSYLSPQSSGCINHTGGKHRQGYRMCAAIRKSDGKKIMTVVHRIAMRMKLNRAITSKEYVIHSCDNDECVNPDHLILGDGHLRNEYMKKRGTQRAGHNNTGSRKVDANGNPIKQNRQYKYTEKQLLWFRTATAKEIAKTLKVSMRRAYALRFGAKVGYRWLNGTK